MPLGKLTYYDEVKERTEALLARVPVLGRVVVSPGRPQELQVAIGGKKTLRILYKERVFPKDVGGIVEEFQLLAQKEGKVYGVVAAPFLSEETSHRLQERGLGTLDLSGNHHLCFGAVFLEAVGKENRYKEAKESRSLFAPKAQRILRVLLQAPLRHWNGKDLAKSSSVSQGWVSQVRQGLIARDWVTADGQGVIVTKPREILKAWAGSDRWEERTDVHEFSSVLPKGEMVESLSELLGNRLHAFTQWTAAERRRPATESDVVSAYVEDFSVERDLQSTLLARPVARNGNLRLVVPKDRGVFLGTRSVQGIPLVSDAQIWLDLLRAGNRGVEQAEALWEWDGFGGWAK